MTKQEAKEIVRYRYGKIVRGRCQVNYHGAGEYSICWEPDPEAKKFRKWQHFKADSA